MTFFRSCVLLVLAATSIASAEPLKRADITAIPAGPLAFEKTLLRDVLVAIKNTAATKDIVVWADQEAILASRQETMTLHADGLTLDALLEFATSRGGMDWRIQDDKVMVFSTAKLRAAHRARKQSRTCQQLDKIIIPEIKFNGIEVPDAFAQVRTEAIRTAGLGAVPKIDLPATPTVVKTISFTASKVSVLTLFDLIAASSVSTIEWRFAGSRVVLIDEARIREQERLYRLEVARARLNKGGLGGGDVDPFASGPSLPARPPQIPKPNAPQFHTEAYDHFGDNPFFSPRQEPLSTFSIDVDTASYANVRRLIRSGGHLPVDAARIEEFINYFDYDYAPPAPIVDGQEGEAIPFATHLEVASAPWAPKHRLVRIALKGREIEWARRPPSNLVFLLDVSGSMQSANKLDLVKKSLELLIQRLDERDRVSIVVYAGASGLVLPPTPGNEREKVRDAIKKLEAGGSTNGGAGIALAYRTAREHFQQGGNNRVILCTDGDFNTGMTARGSLVEVVEDEAKSGVFLTVLGFGMGNYKDGMLETLSNKGNGNYAYVDSFREARKVFVEDLTGTLVTIAKDVKVQVEFNPAKVGAYRLIGYENRLLEAQDFDDDTKDAGEIGAGHTVTAFYEIVPPGMEDEILKAVSPLKYQKVKPRRIDPDAAAELLTLKLRYKDPDGKASKLLRFPLTDPGNDFANASTDFQFASAVACLGMILRDSEYRNDATPPLVLEIARSSLGDDPNGYRKEFLELAERVNKRKLR